MSTRKASHAGSWYSDNGKELNKQLENWLKCFETLSGPARAIISPHAGYRYCGVTAGCAFRQINPDLVKRVFILGPSHNVRLGDCALSPHTKYATPLYDLIIDTQVYEELQRTEAFEWMSEETDREEHSIEMQLPFIAKVFESKKDKFTIVPILVGSLTPDKEAEYGRILHKYLASPENLFVISSDFCHWGQRFRYTYTDKLGGDIFQSIQRLDKQGMDIIESMEPTHFTEYLKRFGNTICGRHPIGVLLNMIYDFRRLDSPKLSLKFLHYAQSSQCRHPDDSSVSYAAASLSIL
uniref:EOG090X09ZA n=1 Tax=Lynceus sp. MCZ IZ 141354 TaxID=1930659 RepID=A0A9N6ZFY2_9CRUS|nr:EOG090X09ZA [Lynceus sp. MCZ IZ 141354]